MKQADKDIELQQFISQIITAIEKVEGTIPVDVMKRWLQAVKDRCTKEDLDLKVYKIFEKEIRMRIAKRESRRGK